MAWYEYPDFTWWNDQIVWREKFSAVCLLFTVFQLGKTQHVNTYTIKTERYNNFMLCMKQKGLKLKFLGAYHLTNGKQQETESQMVSAISFSWFADFGKSFTIIQCSPTWFLLQGATKVLSDSPGLVE